MVVEAAGLTLSNMVFVNPYLTSEIPMRIMNEHYARRFEFGNTPGRAPRSRYRVSLKGAHIAYTGVAVRDLAQRRRHTARRICRQVQPRGPCIFAGDTLLTVRLRVDSFRGQMAECSHRRLADQVRQTMRNLLDNLEEAGMKFDQVVSTTIYLDDLSESAAFGKVYRKYFGGVLPGTDDGSAAPARGSKNPTRKGTTPDLEQVSLIAVRSPSKR